MMNPFTPGTTATLAVTTSSARAALTNPSALQVRIANPAGAQIAFIAFGDVTVAATVAAGLPILPGTVEVFSVAGQTHVAAITGTSTATIYATSGDGL